MRKMKDSGVEWIGEIPEKWSVWKMKHLASEPMQYGANATGVEYSESLPRYVRITDITTNRTLSNEGKQSLPTEIAEEYILEDGDILFARSGATAGKSFYYESKYGDCAFAGYLIRFKADFQKANSKFLYYYTLTQAYEEWSQQIFIQATIQNISAEKYNGLRFAIPDNIEQQNEIVEYLDKKCAEIDSLIEAKEKTNALLKEQRQSIIYEAVTKGLNPDVPMKDSGIEWIGEIPESWKISRFRSEFSFGKGLSITKADLTEDGIGVVSYGQIHSKVNIGTSVKKEMIKFVNEKYMDTNISSLTFTGDIIFADTSEDLLGCGNCVYVDTDEPIFAGYHTIISRPKERKNAKYYAYLFATDAWRSQIRAKASGVKLFSITQAMLRDALIILPNEIDMSKIVTFLDDKCSQIDTLIESNITTIEKLKEYRKSIIFEAVTGKVEV